MRIANILKNARYSLADPAKERYSDERLLALLDEAHKDFAKETKLLKAELEIPIFAGQVLYSLPDDVYQILRCSCDNLVLPMTSFDEMDQFAKRQWTQQTGYCGVSNDPNYSLLYDTLGFAWENVTGTTIDAVIIDKRKVNEIRIWPIQTENAYSFEAGGPQEYTGQELLGVVTSVDGYTITNTFGEVASFVGPGSVPENIDTFGVVTGFVESAKVLRVQYVKTPADLVSTTDQLLTAPQWDIALKRYVIGHAFRDDLDTQYRQRGAEELALYAQQVALAKELESTNSARSPNLFTVAYRTPFT